MKNSIMDETDLPLFDVSSVSEAFLSEKGTQVAFGANSTNTGQPRNQTRTGQSLARRGHSKSGDQWLDVEPDYRESEDYKAAKKLVKERVVNVMIVSYGGLGRYLGSIDPKYVTYLDSIIDDLTGEGIVSFDKYKPAPNMVRKAEKQKKQPSKPAYTFNNQTPEHFAEIIDRKRAA